MLQRTTQTEIFVNPEPFTPRVEKMFAPPGKDIATILARACNDGKLLLDDVDRVVVYVNGLELAENETLDYVTKPGDVVNVAVAPLGGGRGSDSSKVLQAVLTIAIIVISFWVGGPAGPLAAIEGLKGVLIRAAAAALIQVGGSLAVNAIFKPEQDQLADANDRRSLQDQSNQFRPRDTMPLVLGKRRVAFDLAARAYTQLVGNDMWLHVIFGIHYGKSQVEDIKIGETLLADYPAEDIETELLLDPGPKNSTIYPGRVIQENLSDQLELGASTWEVHTSATSPDRIELDFTFPSGLRYNKENGKILPQEIQFLVEESPAGANTWTPAPVPAAFNRVGVLLPAGSVYVQARTQDPVRVTTGWDIVGGIQKDVRVKAWDPDGDDPNTVTENTYWTAIRTIEYTPPIVDENLGILAMRIRASDDLSGSLPTVTGVVTPIVPIWDGSDWDTEAPSSNAAALARWLLTGVAAAAPLDPDDEIHSSCQTAYELIEENEWEGSLLITGEMSQENVLNALGRMGRFATYWNGSKLCFVPDWEKPTARQMFTGINAQGYRYKRVFPKDIHAVLVEYVNEEKDWQADELWVYNDGYDSSNADLFETLRLDYSCKMDKAFRDGRVYLAKRKLQVESHEWTAGADAIVSTFGDRVRVRHKTTLFGLGEAHVLFRRFTGGLVSGLRLDNAIEMEAGKTYSIDVRSGDSVILGLELITVPGIQREIQLAVPLAVVDAPEKGDLLVFGEVGVVTEDLEIINFDPQGEDQIAITAQLYAADAIMAAETGPIPPLQSSLPDRQEAPIPRIIRADGSPNGVRVTFDINPTFKDQIQGFAIRWRRAADDDIPAGTWQVLPNLPAGSRQAMTPAVPEAAVPPEDDETDGQYRVDVEIRTIMKSDKYSRAASAYGILVSKNIPEPLNLTADPAVRTAPDGSSYPVIEVGCTPVIGGEVQDLIVEYKKSSEASTEYISGGLPLAASNPFGDITGVLGGETYDVRVRWRTQDNWRSDWVTEAGVFVPEGGLVSVDTVNLGGLPANDIIDSLTALGETTDELHNDILDVVADLTVVQSDLADEVTARLGGDSALNTLITTETSQRVTADTAQVHTLSLIGAETSGGLAFQISSTTLLVTPTETLNTRLTSIESRFGGSSSSYLLTQINANATSAAASASSLSLLGAKNGAGTAFILNTSTTYVGSDGTSLATYIQGLSVDNSEAAAIADTRITVQLGPGGSIASSINTVSTVANGAQADATLALSSVNGNQATVMMLTQVGGKVTGLKINGATSNFDILASKFRIVDDSGASPIVPFSVISGFAYFINPITVSSGGKQCVTGPGFGASSDLILWFGPSGTAMGSMTKTNGYFALATDGKVYYGTAELITALPTGNPLNVTASTLDCVFSGAGVNNPHINATTNSVTVSPTGGNGSYNFYARCACGDGTASHNAFPTTGSAGPQSTFTTSFRISSMPLKDFEGTGTVTVVETGAGWQQEITLKLGFFNTP